MNYAILNADGVCINRILWDGNNDWQPSEGCTAVPDPDNTYSVVSEAEAAPVLTTEQKLEAAGLTVEELRELFGLTQ